MRGGPEAQKNQTKKAIRPEEDRGKEGQSRSKEQGKGAIERG